MCALTYLVSISANRHQVTQIAVTTSRQPSVNNATAQNNVSFCDFPLFWCSIRLVFFVAIMHACSHIFGFYFSQQTSDHAALWSDELLQIRSHWSSVNSIVIFLILVFWCSDLVFLVLSCNNQPPLACSLGRDNTWPVDNMCEAKDSFSNIGRRQLGGRGWGQGEFSFILPLKIETPSSSHTFGFSSSHQTTWHNNKPVTLVKHNATG